MNRPPSSFLDSYVFTISPQEAGQRIDKLLSDRFPDFSRSYFQYLLASNLVLINGKPAKKREIPQEADEIEISFELTPELSLEPQPMDFQVLFEDEYFLAINKPPGLVVHPAPGHRTGTFVNGLLAHCQHLSTCDDPLRPGIVHRLDKETSGVLLAVKTKEAHMAAADLFASRQMEKHYLAICCGRPSNGTIDAPIGRHPVHRKEMTVKPEGKEASSHIQVVAFNPQISCVLVRPKTGRTHQIRVHLKHIGHPILGDPVYGNKKMNRDLSPTRLLLHAYRLTFIHPFTKQPLQLSAPIPEDLQYWIKRCASTDEK